MFKLTLSLCQIGKFKMHRVRVIFSLQEVFAPFVLDIEDNET